VARRRPRGPSTPWRSGRTRVARLSLLARAAPPLISQRAHARCDQPPRLELARELRDDVPSADHRRLRDRARESIVDAAKIARFHWPKRDHFTRTYVGSRKVIRT
jgi:hypothetical protein